MVLQTCWADSPMLQCSFSLALLVLCSDPFAGSDELHLPAVLDQGYDTALYPAPSLGREGKPGPGAGFGKQAKPQVCARQQ